MANAPGPDLELALRLADLADTITRERFRAVDLMVETKPDLSPVTEADQAVERRCATNRARAPGTRVLGEEFGRTPGGGAGSSTRSTARRATCGACRYGRRSSRWSTRRRRVGVVSAPALGTPWWAARGEGSFVNGPPYPRVRRSRSCPRRRAEPTPASCPGSSTELGEQFLNLARGCWRTRGFRGFWSHMLVAEGAADVARSKPSEVEPLGPGRPPQVIVEEAPGKRSPDLGGDPDPRGRGAAWFSSNGLLHPDLLEAARELAP